MRAIALKWFGAVARHPETGTNCALCERGSALYCAQCFINQVANQRTTLLKTGTTIGEPAGWTRLS